MTRLVRPLLLVLALSGTVHAQGYYGYGGPSLGSDFARVQPFNSYRGYRAHARGYTSYYYAPRTRYAHTPRARRVRPGWVHVDPAPYRR